MNLREEGQIQEVSMQSCSFDTAIPESRQLELTLPDNFPTGAAEIVVLVRSKPSVSVPMKDLQQPCATLDDFFAWLNTQPATGRSREEIDAQIAEERDSWGDD
jgi:hypothetical protein